MSFKWQFGCGCNLDRPESCYPQLFWRSIRLSELKNKVLNDRTLTRTGLLIVRLNSLPCITNPGDSLLKVTSLKETSESELRNIDYIYADDSFINSFGQNGTVANSSLNPFLIQHYYHPTYDWNGRLQKRKLTTFTFEKFQNCSQFANPTSNVLPTFFIPSYREQAEWLKTTPSSESLAYAFENLERLWGDVMVMVVKCCNPPSTTYQKSQPLRLVGETRTGRVEWNSFTDITFKTPYKDDGWTVGSFTPGNVQPYVRGIYLIYNTVLNVLVHNSRESWNQQNFLFSNTMDASYEYRNKLLPITYDDIVVDNNDVCCIVNASPLAEDNLVKTGYISYYGEGSIKNGTIRYEQRPSGFTLPDIVRWNYSSLDFRGVYYDVDYNVDQFTYEILLNQGDSLRLIRPGSYINSFGYLKTDGGLYYTKGAFRNDPSNQGDSSSSVKRIALPDVFFESKKIRFRITFDKVFYSIYGYASNSFPYMKGCSFAECLQTMQNATGENNCYCLLKLQSPVAFDNNNNVYLTYKKDFDETVSAPVYDKNGEIIVRITGDAFAPKFCLHCQVNDDNEASGRPAFVTVSPNDSQAAYFRDLNEIRIIGAGYGANANGVEVIYLNSYLKSYLESNCYYGFLSRGLNLKQDFWSEELKNKDLKSGESFFVSVYCTGSFDQTQVQEINNDLYSRIASYFGGLATELNVRVPIRCWTDNIFCVDLKQQFYNEDGKKINLIESKPE